MKYNVDKAADRLEELNSRYHRSQDTPEDSEKSIKEVLDSLTKVQLDEVVTTIIHRWYFN
jgi:hypothetical protein